MCNIKKEKELLDLNIDELLDLLFKIIELNDFEKEQIANIADSFEIYDSELILYSYDCNPIIDIQINDNGTLELLSTYLD